MAGSTVGVCRYPGSSMVDIMGRPVTADGDMTGVTVLSSAAALTSINDILRRYCACTRIHISCILVTGQAVAGARTVGRMQINTVKRLAV